MEITAMELANISGLSYSGIVSAVRRGAISNYKNEHGQVRFDRDKALAQMAENGIKARRRKGTPTPVDEPDDDPNPECLSESESVSVLPEFSILMGKAFRKACGSFKKEVRKQVNECSSSQDKENELKLLRLYVLAEDIFDEMRNQLIEGKNHE